jgi:hypothetical protein
MACLGGMTEATKPVPHGGGDNCRGEEEKKGRGMERRMATD